MIGAAGKILRILDRRERGQIFTLVILVVASAFVEMAGVASILPFIAVLADPNEVQANPWLGAAYDFFAFASVDQYLIALGAAILILMVLGNVLKAWTRWRILDLSHGIGADVSCRLFAHYIGQPYGFFLKKHSAHLSNSVLAEAQSLAKDILIPSLDMIARSFLALAVIGLLVAVDPVLALGAAAILGAAYAIVYFIFRTRLLRYGTQRQQAQKERHKVVQEAFQGIKNIKLTGHEETYRQYYEGPSRRFAASLSLSGAIGDMPRYILEVVGVGAIMLALLYMMAAGNDLADVLPVLALYAFAGYRLMPNLQIIYMGISRLRFNAPVIDFIASELEAANGNAPAASPDIQPLAFHDTIVLRGVGFSYDQGERAVFDHIDLTIKANTTVGIVGRTGSGKTTLVDILIGLLDPRAGKVFVDGVPVSDANRRAWQANIAYVSQHIYLSDDTVRANIAFGVAPDDVDNARVSLAARLAHIEDFIEGELPARYDTLIGDNGIRLSGGQRQRMALARALYLDRPVLVLDEVTSALDETTETSVMQAITGLARQKTIIIISHRPSIARQCDQIFSLSETGALSEGI